MVEESAGQYGPEAKAATADVTRECPRMASKTDNRRVDDNAAADAISRSQGEPEQMGVIVGAA